MTMLLKIASTLFCVELSRIELFQYLGTHALRYRSATGGFKAGKVSVANVLSVGQSTKGGKTYYEYEILTRTADGDEGGRHHLISVAASGGKLYTFIGQAGDKRWFKVS